METLTTFAAIETKADDWFGIIIAGDKSEKQKIMDEIRNILSGEKKEEIDRMLLVLKYTVGEHVSRKEMITKAFLKANEEELLNKLKKKGFQLEV